jgi:hypothetical protein
VFRGLQGIKGPSELPVYRSVSLIEDLPAETKLDDGVDSKMLRVVGLLDVRSHVESPRRRPRRIACAQMGSTN